MTSDDRYRDAARRALDEEAPRAGENKMIGWYTAYAGDFDQEARSATEPRNRRLAEELRDESRRRADVIRNYGDIDWPVDDNWRNPW